MTTSDMWLAGNECELVVRVKDGGPVIYQASLEHASITARFGSRDEGELLRFWYDPTLLPEDDPGEPRPRQLRSLRIVAVEPPGSVLGRLGRVPFAVQDQAEHAADGDDERGNGLDGGGVH